MCPRNILRFLWFPPSVIYMQAKSSRHMAASILLQISHINYPTTAGMRFELFSIGLSCRASHFCIIRPHTFCNQGIALTGQGITLNSECSLKHWRTMALCIGQIILNQIKFSLIIADSYWCNYLCLRLFCNASKLAFEFWQLRYLHKLMA